MVLVKPDIIPAHHQNVHSSLHLSIVLRHTNLRELQHVGSMLQTPSVQEVQLISTEYKRQYLRTLMTLLQQKLVFNLLAVQR